jgi:hypothetical protein
MNSDEGCGYGDVGAYDSGVQSMFTIENKKTNQIIGLIIARKL